VPRRLPLPRFRSCHNRKNTPSQQKDDSFEFIFVLFSVDKMATCNLEFDKIQTISASNSNGDGFKYYDDEDEDHFGNFATSRQQC